MDWVIEAGDGAGLRAVRAEVDRYLRRHGDGDHDGAALLTSELITNGFGHAPGPVWVSLDWAEANPVLRVRDLGAGFDFDPKLPSADSITGRGLYIASQLTSELEARRRAVGGSEVTARLPVTRSPSVTLDPPRRRTNVLPSLDEALPTGGFGKESFLRALVVQLAQSIAEQQQPEAAEAAVAQVGIDVGGQMEAEYRQAKGISAAMTTEQLGDCYTRLKRAIDGDFSVVEISENRIVLENSRCPFEAVVSRAPSLCRMTSAVFGGIAARNSQGAAQVTLEERIALGDPKCRVVVELDPSGPAKPWAHRYRSPI